MVIWSRLGGVAILILMLKLIGASLGLIVTIILSRLMDPGEFGEVMFGISLAMVLSMFSCLNIESGNFRFLTKYFQKNELDRAKGYLNYTVKLLLSVSGLLIFVAIVLSALTLLNDWSPQSVSNLYIISIAMLLAPAIGYLRIKAVQGHAVGVIIRSFIVPSIFPRTIIVIVLYILYMKTEQVSAEWVLLLYIASFVVSIFSQKIIQGNIFQEINASSTTDFGDRDVWLRYGFYMLLPIIFVQYSAEVTILLASLVVDDTDIGVYAVCARIVGVISFAVLAINQAISPRLASYLHDNNYTEARKILVKSGRLKLVIISLAMLMLMFFAENILLIFGETYKVGSGVLIILLLAPLVTAIVGPAIFVISVLGVQKEVIKIYLSSFVLLVVLTLVLGEYLGNKGVAFGSVFVWLVLYVSLRNKLLKSHNINVSLF